MKFYPKMLMGNSKVKGGKKMLPRTILESIVQGDGEIEEELNGMSIREVYRVLSANAIYYVWNGEINRYNLNIVGHGIAFMRDDDDKYVFRLVGKEREDQLGHTLELSEYHITWSEDLEDIK